MTQREVDLVLDGGSVVTVDSERRVFSSGAIAIDGDAIVAVGRREDVAAEWRGRRVIDTSNSLVFPGLVCTHSHAFQVLYRGLGDDLELFGWLSDMIYPLSAHLGAEEAYNSTLLCAMDLMKAGSTTLADSFYIHVDPDAFDAVCHAASDSGIRALLGRASIDKGEAPDAFKERHDVALARTEKALNDWPWRDGARVRAVVEALNPPSTSGELMRELANLSRDHGSRFHLHAAETGREAREIRSETGKGVFEYLDQLGLLSPQTLLVHAVWTLPHEIPLIRDSGAPVSHNPVSNMGGSGIAPIPAMLRAGVTVGLGVDGAASNHGQDMLETMKFTHLLHWGVSGDGISAERVLEMATIEGARALSLDHEIGSIEVGKKADIAAIDRSGKPYLSPGLKPVSDLIMCAKGSDVDTVIVDGNVIIEQRRFTELDEEDVMRQVDATARAMVKKAGVERLMTTPTFRYID
jgi:5-methylthioadenosine/S-adenosylhomocysteine deaminase